MTLEEIQEALTLRLTEAAKVLNFDDSHTALRQKLQQQVATDHRAANTSNADSYYEYPYVEDVYGDGSTGTVITNKRGVHTMATYKQSGDGYKLSGHATVKKAYVKESEEVLVNGEPLAAKESLIEDLHEEMLDLREAAFDANGNGTIKLIAPGHGTTGYYSPEVLKEAVKKGVFDNAQMFIDHATDEEEAARPEGSVHGLAAKGGKATYEEAGLAGPGVYIPAKVYPDVKDFLNNRAADIGVSIRAFGTGVAGQVGGRVNKIVKSLTILKSGDFVTRAGAGGKLLPLLESFRKQGKPALKKEKKEMEIDEKLFASLKESAEQVPVLKLQLARSDERFSRIDAKDSAARLLKESKLPARAQDRLMDMIADSNYVLPIINGSLDQKAFKEAVGKLIEAEANYLKESGVQTRGVTNMGDNGLQLETEPNEDSIKTKEAMTKIETTFREGIAVLSGVKKKAS